MSAKLSHVTDMVVHEAMLEGALSPTCGMNEQRTPHNRTSAEHLLKLPAIAQASGSSLVVHAPFWKTPYFLFGHVWRGAPRDFIPPSAPGMSARKKPQLQPLSVSNNGTSTLGKISHSPTPAPLLRTTLSSPALHHRPPLQQGEPFGWRASIRLDWQRRLVARLQRRPPAIRQAARFKDAAE